MDRLGKKQRGRKRRERRGVRSPPTGRDPFLQAETLVATGAFAEARSIYDGLTLANNPRAAARRENDLAVLDALAGDYASAERRLRTALSLDTGYEEAQANLAVLEFEAAPRQLPAVEFSKPAKPANDSGRDRIRVAVLSFLFNWPSTGGGIVHTVELVDFLGRAGYDVRHVYAKNLPWGVGLVEAPLPFESVVLSFDERTWERRTIQDRFRQAVESVDPDYVIITDSWNFKPLLAEAVRDYLYLLRLQASECLCPLNNLRLLPGPMQCPTHQFASGDECRTCMAQNGHLSGALHQAERELAGVGSPEYERTLKSAFRDAAATLVVNPLTEAMISPHAANVRVVPSGFDASRFPWPWPNDDQKNDDGKTRFFMAGMVDDWIKGFHVLDEACRLLWEHRRDFELVVTGAPTGDPRPYLRSVGWLSQADLPSALRQADVIVVPTIAQDGLGRTAVEGMAVGRPIVASRLGGLPFTIEGAGLLFEPANPVDLARKLETLLDNKDLRQQMGHLGRRRFEDHFTWDVIIDRHYRPILTQRRRPARR